VKAFLRPGARLRAAWGAVAIAGMVALGGRLLEQWRPPSPDRLARVVFRVTTAADSGSGSLREAMFAADKTAGRARIVVAVPRIVLEGPLPPLVNPFGVVLEAERNVAPELDATAVAGVALDVVSPGTVVSGLGIRGGRAGVLIRGRGAQLRGLRVAAAEVGVLVAEGSADATIVDSVFTQNRIGVQLAASSGKTTVRNSRFEDHVTAAVWAVALPAAVSPRTAEIALFDNRFRNDATGVVVVNVAALIERNVFDDEKGTAVHASDARVALGDNRIRGGRGFGVFAERLSSALVSGNEIARNCSGGMLLRRVSNTRVISNQIYQNGYGMVMMQGVSESPNTVADNLIADHIGDGIVLIGASPVVSRNRVLLNHLAGLRLSALPEASGRAVIPTPLLTANVFQGNGRDEPQHDEYDARVRGSVAGQPLADCGWRRGTSAVYAAQMALERR
jgi:hypothetical protein